jgi:hypothetical protein
MTRSSASAVIVGRVSTGTEKRASFSLKPPIVCVGEVDLVGSGS